MGKKIILNQIEYDVDNISDGSMIKINLVKFTTQKIKELNNMHAILQRAKSSYMDSLKKEILSKKSGLTFED